METKVLDLNELQNISGGYIVKDEGGYHVINDTEGYEIHTFQEEEYDLMMKCIRRTWKVSEEYISWDQAKEIHRKSLEEFLKAHPDIRWVPD